jgi:hypothetical protein
LKKNEPLMPNDNTHHGERGSGANSGGRALLALVNTVGRRYRSLWSLKKSSLSLATLPTPVRKTALDAISSSSPF